MGWAVGYDGDWNRDVGYGVPAWCDHPDCTKNINRGLAFVCGGEPYGGDRGCGLYFCGDHLYIGGPGNDPQMCQRCCDGGPPFNAKPDHPEWLAWKLADESWAQWRADNPEDVAAITSSLAVASERAGRTRTATNSQ